MTHTSQSRRLHAFAASSLFAATCALACGEEAPDVGYDTTDINRADHALELKGMVLHDRCGEAKPSECNRCYKRFQDATSDCYDSCRTAASLSGNFSSNCSDRCSPSSPISELCEHACAGDKNKSECERRELEFELTTNPNEDLRQACEAALEEQADCDREAVNTDCQQFSLVESPKVVIPVYECIAELSCDENADRCMETLPEGMLLAELSARCDSTIDPDIAELLEFLSPWVRPELQEDALTCAQHYCETPDYENCLVAWLVTTIGR